MTKIVSKVLVIVVIAVTTFFFANFGRKSNTFYGDALGYYLYLPASFIYHNFKTLEKVPVVDGINSEVAWYLNQMEREGLRTPKGYVIDQYTYGIALMELPFFAAAHAYEKISGLPANGYSRNYDMALKISTMVYALLGLLLIYKVLRQYFSKEVSLVTILLITAGTNLFWFSLHQAGMAHVPLFFLYAALMLASVRVYKNPKPGRFILTGFIAGMITLIRPTDIICLLIPFLYGVYNKALLMERVDFIKTHYKYIILAAIFFVLPAIPQLVYWKVISGQFLYYSYGNQEFYWTHPSIIPGLFWFSNGWLAYSPLMVFSLIGLFFYKKFSNWHWCLWIIIPMYIYIIYSWFCFNYINGFGSRPMINIYPLLALPLAAFIQGVTSRKFFAKAIFSLVCLFFIAVNVTQSMQQSAGLLHSEDSNMMYNLSILFKTKIDYNDIVCYDTGEVQPDADKLIKLATLAENRFDDSTSAQFVRDTIPGSKYVYHIGTEEYPQVTITVPFNKDIFKDAKWFKCSGRFMNPAQSMGYYKHLFVLDVKRSEDHLTWRGCKIETKTGISDSSCGHKEFNLYHFEIQRWSPAYFFVKVPGNIKEGDVVVLSVWNIGKEELYADDFLLELYK